MEENRVLKALDKIGFLFEKLGINYKLMRTILKMKLTLDKRRVPTVLSNNMKNKKDKNMFYSSLLVYIFLGIIMMFMVIMDTSLFVKMSLCTGINMFFLMMIMISDFSSVLLNVKDKNIMMTKPIDYKTYNGAKITHILIYLFYISFSMNILAMIAGTIKHGVLFLLIYIIELILICAFTIFITSFVYSLILKFYNGEKLKDIINGFQIIFTIIIAVGYQILGRSMTFINIKSDINIEWWSYLIPSVWFAAPYEVILEGNIDKIYMALCFSAFIIPIVCIYVHFKLIAPKFERNLLKLNQGGNNKNSHKKHEKAIIKNSLYKIISNNNISNTFIRFTSNILSSERELKLKLYPSLALSSIFPFLYFQIAIDSSTTFRESLVKIGKSDIYFSGYLSVLIMSSLFIMIIYSAKYKGAWIYKTLPIDNPSIVIKSAYKSFVIKYYFKVFLLISIIFLWIFGNRIIIDLIIMFVNLLIGSLIYFESTEKNIPFSKSFSDFEQNNIVAFITVFAVIAILAFVHYIIRNMIVIKMAYCGILIILLTILYNKILNMDWSITDN
ncbi:MAG: ABC transporter permease [Vallitalea sp.]|nr:ABC transporter permease [Vallitalea sp.]